MADVQPRLSETPGRIRNAGLPMGVRNEEIYRELLGLTEEELKALKADGVIWSTAKRETLKSGKAYDAREVFS
jgi:hypothetical protein